MQFELRAGFSKKKEQGLWLRTRGVIQPECLDKNVRKLFIAELANRGMRICEATEKVLNTT